MLEQDYLMRIVLQFAEMIRRSWTKAHDERDPKSAADMLEDAVGEATDIDGGVLLSLAPESIASVMQVSGVDPRVTEYIARSLLLASGYLHEAGQHALADVREAQARAVAAAYDIELPASVEDLEDLLGEADLDIAEATEGDSGLIDIETDPAIPSIGIVQEAEGDRLHHEGIDEVSGWQKRQE